MKINLLSIALLTVVFIAASPVNAAKSVDVTVKFSVEKMTCATCPISVRKAMQRVDGVKDVDIDFDTKIVTVVYNPRLTTATAIGRASSDVGFPATEISYE